MGKSIYLTLLLGLLVASCEQRASQNIEITHDFLGSHEWEIDSIYGEDTRIWERLYFTPENEFYRSSRSKRGYLVDSAFEWNGNKIFKDGKTIYEISAIDSHHIELNAFSKVYRAERTYNFDQKDLEELKVKHKYKLMINGAWRLDSMDAISAMMPSFCKEIETGTVYNFYENGSLIVSQKDSVEACGHYSYRINKDEISITEYDMVMSFPIAEINETKLVLFSKFGKVANPDMELIMKGLRNQFKMHFTKIEPEAKGL